MKMAIPFVTSCVVILTAGAFLSNRQASGQGRPGVAAVPERPANSYLRDAANPYLRDALVVPHDPELQSLFQEENKAADEASKLMKEYSGTDNEEKRAKIKTKVAEALGKQFDAQQKRRDLELVRLEAQMKKVRELMKKRTEARTTIIEKRLDQLMREADGLGWAAPQGPNFRNFPSDNRLAPIPVPPGGRE